MSECPNESDAANKNPPKKKPRGLGRGLEDATPLVVSAPRTDETSEMLRRCATETVRRAVKAHAFNASRASSGGVVTNLENATGLYKAELEGKLKGEDIFDHHAFLRAPTGTQESPCVVESTMEYRVVGSPDPDDDSIIHWGRLEEGAPPMKIGGEWFVHKRVPGGGHHH